MQLLMADIKLIKEKIVDTPIFVGVTQNKLLQTLCKVDRGSQEVELKS